MLMDYIIKDNSLTNEFVNKNANNYRTRDLSFSNVERIVVMY